MQRTRYAGLAAAALLVLSGLLPSQGEPHPEWP